MIRKKVWGLLGAGLVLSLSGLASAQEAAAGASVAAPAPVVASADEGHAVGVMVQARLQAQGGLLSLGGGPSFTFGYQGPSFSLGLGVGLNRIAASSGDTAGSATLFQVMPTATFDLWHSRDGRTRANLLAAVGYGRASISAKTATQDCAADINGVPQCSTRTEEGGGGISFVPVMLGFGGDYFLSRNFALGAEMGAQTAFVTGVDSTESSVTKSVNGAGSMQLLYGALRATVVLGD